MERADKAEEIKWRDALDLITQRGGFARGLRMARECSHPNAQWLSSLFPGDADVAMDELLCVMKEQGDDMRALYIRGKLHDVDFEALLQRAAELGYAPAQMVWSKHALPDEKLVWAEKSAAQGDRDGLLQFGRVLREMGQKDRGEALIREAAELGHPWAQYLTGESFGENDWRRYRWWGLAAARKRLDVIFVLRVSVKEQLQRFEQSGCTGRVVFELGCVFRGQIDVEQLKIFGNFSEQGEVEAARRCMELHDAWCAAAKAASECWIGVARMLGVVKEIRFVIARMIRAEPWVWSKVGVESKNDTIPTESCKDRSPRCHGRCDRSDYRIRGKQ